MPRRSHARHTFATCARGREGDGYDDEDDDHDHDDHDEDGEDYEETRMRFALDRLLSRLQSMVSAQCPHAAHWRAGWLAVCALLAALAAPRRLRFPSAAAAWHRPALRCGSHALPLRHRPPLRTAWLQPNITLTEAELTEWDTAYTQALDSMGDEDKEADLNLLQEKLATRLKGKGVEVRAALPLASAHSLLLAPCARPTRARLISTWPGVALAFHGPPALAPPPRPALDTPPTGPRRRRRRGSGRGRGVRTFHLRPV